MYHHIFSPFHVMMCVCVSVFSYVLTGTDKGMTETFGSTCHGAVSNIACNHWNHSFVGK